MGLLQANGDLAFGFRSAREERFPIMVQLAMTHYICNSQCLYCPAGLEKRGWIGQDKQCEFAPELRCFFSFELLPKIAEEMARHPWSILRLHGRGEPLMHPHCVEIVALAKQAGVGTVTCFTNAILLDEPRAETLLDAGLDLLEISVDAYSEDLYRYLRGTEYFTQVVANAEGFIRARNRRGASTRVIVSAVDSPEFQCEKEMFRRFWNERADTVIVRPYHTHGGRLKTIPHLTANDPVPCAQFWTRFVVNPWGRVNACINDWADEAILGDLNAPGSSIASIWRGPRFEALRESCLATLSGAACCHGCCGTKAGWTDSYQLLLQKVRAVPPNPKLT